MAENKQEEAFRVIDRRPFTSEGEIRQDVVEAEERKAEREAETSVRWMRSALIARDFAN